MSFLRFSEPKPLQYLKMHGIVYTVRGRKNSQGARTTRPLMMRVNVSLVCPFTTNALERYGAESGFETVKEWEEAIMRQRPRLISCPEDYVIFKVERIDEEST